MKLFIVYDKKVVAKSSGEPREFGTLGAVHRFIRNNQLFGAKHVTSVDGVAGRIRINPR